MDIMPKVYSDPLHELIIDLLTTIKNNAPDEASKNKFSDMLQKVEAAPTWRPGQAYVNPSKLVTPEIKK